MSAILLAESTSRSPSLFISIPWQEHIITHLTLNNPKTAAASLNVVDMDGDGDPDIVMGEYRIRFSEHTEYPAHLWVFENLGQGASWREHLVYFGDSHFQAAEVIDINGDGDLDIASKGWVAKGVFLYENKAVPQACN